MAGYDGHGVNLDQLDAFKSDLKKAFNHLLSLRNVIIYTIPFPGMVLCLLESMLSKYWIFLNACPNVFIKSKLKCLRFK